MYIFELVCDLRNFLATIQFVTKTLASGVRGKVNIEYVMLLPKQSESLFSCLQGRRTADIFVATKWANPQYSEYEYISVQYSYHFRFAIFVDTGCVLSDSIFVHFYEDETTRVWTVIVIFLDKYIFLFG